MFDASSEKPPPGSHLDSSSANASVQPGSPAQSGTIKVPSERPRPSPADHLRAADHRSRRDHPRHPRRRSRPTPRRTATEPDRSHTAEERNRKTHPQRVTRRSPGPSALSARPATGDGSPPEEGVQHARFPQYQQRAARLGHPRPRTHRHSHHQLHPDRGGPRGPPRTTRASPQNQIAEYGHNGQPPLCGTGQPRHRRPTHPATEHRADHPAGHRPDHRRTTGSAGRIEPAAGTAPGANATPAALTDGFGDEWA
jgi:hypothetical protein